MQSHSEVVHITTTRGQESSEMKFYQLISLSAGYEKNKKYFKRFKENFEPYFLVILHLKSV